MRKQPASTKFVTKIKRPAPFGHDQGRQEVEYFWGDNEHQHVITLKTGDNISDPELIKYFFSARDTLQKAAEYGLQTGQGLWRFLVTTPDLKKLEGVGFLPPYSRTHEIAHLFTKFRQRGLSAHIAPNLDYLPEIALGFPEDDPRPIPPSSRNVTLHYFPMEVTPYEMRGSIGISKGEKMPRRFRGMYWNKLADYEAIHESGVEAIYCLVTSLISENHNSETPIFGWDKKNGFEIIGSIKNDAPDKGGYEPYSCGRLPTGISPHELALLGCKLAWQNLFLTLVPDADAHVDPDILIKMASFEPNRGFTLEESD
jgi:hypothetical protein